jgi:hypothetical protein
MSFTTNVTENNIFQALGLFLQEILPSSVTVIRGQSNRVSEPRAGDYAVMWPLLSERISTNTDSYDDVAFTGEISGTTLTVTAMINGTIILGKQLEANGVAANTLINSQLSGTTGGVGTYQVSVSQSLASTAMQTGSRDVLQPVKRTLQVDIHGPNSADYAQLISTLARDEYGVNFFTSESIGALGIQPLYTSDPRQMPFINGEQQTEEKWVVEVTLQVNPVVSIPQDYAGTVSVGLIQNV